LAVNHQPALPRAADFRGEGHQDHARPLLRGGPAKKEKDGLSFLDMKLAAEKLGLAAEG
jgi:hypothetical protein